MRDRWLLLLVAGALGCTGTITAPSERDRQATAPGPGTLAPGASTGAGVLPLRRLSRIEYANTLRDLLGEAPPPDEEFASEVSGASGYREGATMSPTELDRMLDAVDRMADRYVATHLDGALPCERESIDDACAERFVESFAFRAYRRPPSAEELAELRAVYEAARDEDGQDARGALGDVVRAALLSPHFHYRWERGEEAPLVVGDVIALGPYELASRLSYFLWSSMPDDALFDAAATGELSTLDGMTAQTQRMLADPRAAAGLRSFFAEWLPFKYLEPKATEDEEGRLYRAMMESSLRFIEDLVLGDGDGRYATLLAGEHAFLDEELATLLDAPGVTGSELRRVDLSDPARIGLFTQPAFLAATADSTLSTIIRRGSFVFERLGACQAIPPLTGEIPEPPPRAEGVSVRQQLRSHAEDGVCRGCHQFMDPMGFAFDGYDALGRSRSTDDYGLPIDTRGEMPMGNEPPIAFDDAADLLRQLSVHPLSMRCFAEQVTAYALRVPTTRALRGSFDAAGDRFVATDGDLRDLLLSATHVYSFFYRAPAPGEVLK